MATIGQALTAPESGWKRYDDADSQITVTGTKVANNTDSGLYNSNATFLKNVGDYFQFTFVGTKLRLINSTYSNRSNSIEVIVDGVSKGFYSQVSTTLVYQLLLFEVTGLTDGTHTVKIINRASGNMELDAIDIDDTGYLTVPIGQQLTSPSSGWKRYDSNSPSLKKTGTGWTSETNSVHYNGSCIYSTTTNDKLLFSFIGSKIRIITDRNTNRNTNSMSIKIDGVIEYININGSVQGQTFSYEKTGLSNELHTVIINNESNMIVLDAIDIDSTGRLLHPDEVTDPKDLVVGKRIRAHYSATSGAVGTFSNLGNETYIDGKNDFIPAASSATPNGDFYIIHVANDFKGRKILVADRNVQQSISWDVLNTGGIATKDGLPFDVVMNLSVTSPENEQVKITGSYYNNDMQFHPYKLFNMADDGNNDMWASAGVGQQTVTLEFKKEKKTIGRYKIRPRNMYLDAAPKSWSLEASNDNTNWIKVDERLSETSWIQNNYRTYDIQTPNAYQFYRFVFTQNNGNTTFYEMTEIQLIEQQQDFAFTARLLTGGVSSTDTANSEWNKYIVNGLFPGDNTTWNMTSIYSWTSTTTSSAGNRTVRSSTFNNGGSGGSTTSIGLRPVLVIESLVPPNANPTFDNATLSSSTVHGEDIQLSGTLNDVENDSVSYRILVNGAEIQTWSASAPPPVNVNYTILNTSLLVGPNTIRVEFTDNTNTGSWEGQVTVTDTQPIPDITFKGLTLQGTLDDTEGDNVRYKILINGVQKFPSTGDFTDWAPVPVTILKTFGSSEVNIGQQNTISVIYQDSLSKTDQTWSQTFIGDYIGLMFVDQNDNYYSSDKGDFLKYLAFGTIMAGENSVPLPVLVKNKNGFSITNINLSLSNLVLPDSTTIQLSYSDSPFIANSSLRFSNLLDYDDEVVFYVRVVVPENASPGSGQFDIDVSAQQYS